jgi:alkylhydroperoxidase family enzyme
MTVPRLSPSARGETTADRVMGHRPEVLEAWENLRAALLGPSSTLPPHLKEEVRRTLAQQTGCRFCASLGRPSPDHATRRESLAVAFADAVGSDHTAISDAQVRVLFDEFTIPEIVELLVWISFEYAGQLFGCLIADESATEEEKQAFAASIAELATPHADSRPRANPRHGEL